MKKVFVTTPGESPAVVAEAIDRLKAEGGRVDFVTILTMESAHAQDSVAFLEGHIPAYHEGRVCLCEVRKSDGLYDVDSDVASLEFMNQARIALRDYRKKGWEVYASIAGGGKAMSVLLALVVQFYGAGACFTCWWRTQR